jgi:TldD protein
MSTLATTDKIFFESAGLDRDRVTRLVDDALTGVDDGELFLEYCQSESISFDDGRIRSASFDTAHGFGLRAVADDATGYAHASELSEPAIQRAATAVHAVRGGHQGTLAAPPAPTNRSLYTDENPLGNEPFEAKVKLLSDIDAYARKKDSRVKQVMASLSGEWQAVQILRPDGYRVADLRPLVRLNVAIVCADGDRMETGSHGVGGRMAYSTFIDPAPAGPASCCTRPSATGSKATSTARRPRPSPACWASGSRRRASPWSTTARSPTGAARSPSTTRARPPAKRRSSRTASWSATCRTA